jgi:hypothetical protein
MPDDVTRAHFEEFWHTLHTAFDGAMSHAECFKEKGYSTGDNDRKNAVLACATTFLKSAKHFVEILEDDLARDRAKNN